MEIHDQVRAQFGKTAQAYVESAAHATDGNLQAMLDHAGDLRGCSVLDIATGGGHTALAFARAGAHVTASDLTPAMLAAAQAHLGVYTASFSHPVTFLPAAAEALPLPDASFDFVTCRIAAHHFADPATFVREAARVLKSGGTLLLVDNVAPEDLGLAEVMNHIERERDPSHVEAYSVRRWVNWLADAGLELQALRHWQKRKAYSEWTERSQTPEQTATSLETWVLRLDKPAQEYLGVRVEGGKLVSLHHEAALFVARKPRASLPR